MIKIAAYFEFSDARGTRGPSHFVLQQKSLFRSLYRETAHGTHRAGRNYKTILKQTIIQKKLGGSYMIPFGFGTAQKWF